MAATRVRNVMEAGEGEVELASIARVSDWRLVFRVVIMRKYQSISRADPSQCFIFGLALRGFGYR